MRTPDFHELVGDDLPDEDLAALRAAHDALVAAGPPPELSPRLASPPRVGGGVVVVFARHRRVAAAALGIAAAAILFGIGFSGGWLSRGGFQTQFGPVEMRSTAAAPGAAASIRIGKPDTAGNWPSQMVVQGLPQLPAGRVYALYLTDRRTGKPLLVCSVFGVRRGATTISFSFPGKVNGRGWIVRAETLGDHGHGPVLLTT